VGPFDGDVFEVLESGLVVVGPVLVESEADVVDTVGAFDVRVLVEVGLEFPDGEAVFVEDVV
jgi:hypothetical protein